MMKITNTLFIAVIGLAFIYIMGMGIFFALGLQQKHPVNVGSIALGESYNSTTTSSFQGANNAYLIKSGYGMLGSIVIASTSGAYAVPGSNGAGMFGLYDAFASTATSTASSTLIRIAPGTAAGTYTIDANFSKGLVVDIPIGFNGSYTLTWK